MGFLNFSEMDKHEDNVTSGGILEQNCRENWPRWTCMFANICGLCSTALWFIVLLPQVWKNFRRKSVRGLSVLWATANFTASLINIFFVFIYVSIPLYGQISSIYCPILEFALLIQFVIYGHYRNVEKIMYGAACLTVWGLVIGVELICTMENFVEYAAIFLWCIETFPQIILNMNLQSTSGQSTSSVAIAMVGKTTDFIANTSLVMPLQYVIMVYFSSSVAYINGMQVAWYYGNDCSLQGEGHDESYDTAKIRHEDNIAFNHSVESLEARHDLHHQWNEISTRPNAVLDSANTQLCFVFTIRWVCIVIISFLLIGCVVGFTWNFESYFGLFAPVLIMCILGTAELYFYFYKTSQYSVKGIP